VTVLQRILLTWRRAMAERPRSASAARRAETERRRRAEHGHAGNLISGVSLSLQRNGCVGTARQHVECQRAAVWRGASQNHRAASPLTVKTDGGSLFQLLTGINA
jgi:hypothetical protein